MQILEYDNDGAVQCGLAQPCRDRGEGTVAIGAGGDRVPHAVSRERREWAGELEQRSEWP